MFYGTYMKYISKFYLTDYNITGTTKETEL